MLGVNITGREYYHSGLPLSLERPPIFEAYELSSEDLELFRPHAGDEVERIWAEEKQRKLEGKPSLRKARNYFQSVYMVDYVPKKLAVYRRGNEPMECDEGSESVQKLRRVLGVLRKDYCDLILAQGKSRLAYPQRKPVLPLTTSLRVTPGIAKDFHLPTSEYQDTIERLGFVLMKRYMHLEQEEGEEDGRKGGSKTTEGTEDERKEETLEERMKRCKDKNKICCF